MTTQEKLLDVARVYRAHGAGSARARLVYHGWTVEDATRLEELLAIAGELATRATISRMRSAA